MQTVPPRTPIGPQPASGQVRDDVTGRLTRARTLGNGGPSRMHNPPPGAGGPAGAPQVTPGSGVVGGGVTRAAGAAAPRPADDDLVWILIRRRGIPAHRPDGPSYTACGRSLHPYGEQLRAIEARTAYQVQWCPRCWPEVA